MAAFLANRALRLRPSTLKTYSRSLGIFRRFLRATLGPAPWSAALLSRPLLDRYYAWLHQPETGLHGRPRGPKSRRQPVELVQVMWRWADESDLWGDLLPRPRRIDMARVPPRRVRAPTWSEMDRCISFARGWQRVGLSMLRYTGFRLGEVLGLRWGDVHMDRAELVLRGEITKGGRGRTVPLSPHLLALLRELRGDRRGAEAPVVPYDNGPRQRPREILAATAKAGWVAARVPGPIWKGAPNHTFRRGFKSGMLREGCAPDAVDYLQGHVTSGARGRYIDPWVAFDLREAVRRVPRIGESSRQLDLPGL